MTNKKIIDVNSPIELKHTRVLNVVRSYLQQKKFKYTESISEKTTTIYFYVDIGTGHCCKIRVADHASNCKENNWHYKGFVGEIRSDSKSFPFNKNAIGYVGRIIEQAMNRTKTYESHRMFEKLN